MPGAAGTSLGPSPTAITTSEYASVLADLTSQAAALIASVRAELGLAFDGGRRWLPGNYAAAGADFALDPIAEWIVDPATTAVALGVGTWRVQFSGEAWSRDTTPGASVSTALTLNTTVVATDALTRSLPIPPDTDQIDRSVAFSTTHDLVVGFPQVLALKNAGSFDQRVQGILRWWKP